MLDSKTTNELANGSKSMYTFIIKDDRLKHLVNGYLYWNCVARNLKSAIAKLEQSVNVDLDNAQSVKINKN